MKTQKEINEYQKIYMRVYRKRKPRTRYVRDCKNQRLSRARRRIEAMKILTDNDVKCFCCGEREPEFLCFDHIGNGGTKERNTTGIIGNQVVSRIIREIEEKEKYQVLCYNCNARKHTILGCPHKR